MATLNVTDELRRLHEAFDNARKEHKEGFVRTCIGIIQFKPIKGKNKEVIISLAR